jgi:Rv2175c C-terminal domain of unknown function
MELLEREYTISANPPVEEQNISRWETATKTLLHQVELLLSESRADELEALASALSTVENEQDVSEAEQTLAQKLTGRKYSQAERMGLELTALFQYFERRRELLQDSLTAAQVGRLLGTTRQTPHDRAEKGFLLAVLDKGVWKFPVWQFDPEGPDGMVAGFSEVLKVLPGSNFSKLNWWLTPNGDLEHKTPIATLKAGKKTAVLREAQALGAW